MHMDGWQDRLHISFLGEHFLFGGLRINSFWSFGLASLMTVCFCLSERMLTLALSKHWNPFPFTRRSRLRIALWRTVLYWFVTLARLIYMLIAMTFHLGIIVVTVTALSAGQFAIEYIDATNSPTTSLPQRSYRSNSSREFDHIKEPLLRSPCLEEDEEAAADFSSGTPLSVSRPYPQDDASYPPSTQLSTNWEQPFAAPTQRATTTTTTRPRSRSKPEEIFIHPAHSNVVRAEALAIKLGLATGDSELVDASSYTTHAPMQDQPNEGDDHRWGGGKGRGLAREILLGSTRGSKDGGGASGQNQRQDGD